jgi:hypothetical protein
MRFEDFEEREIDDDDPLFDYSIDTNEATEGDWVVIEMTAEGPQVVGPVQVLRAAAVDIANALTNPMNEVFVAYLEHPHEPHHS